MILEVYSLYDNATKTYGQPFFQVTRNQALRTFRQWAQDPLGTVKASPSDYTLLKIGEFDDSTCTLTPLEVLDSLGNANQFPVKES